MYARLVVLCFVLCLSPLWSAVAQPPVPRFESAPCPYAYPIRSAVKCGYVVTPERHADPDGPTIRVMVAIFPAQTPTPEPDPVIYLQGGPGSSGMARFQGGLDGFGNLFIRNRDYIILDQRGIGQSLPLLDCPEIQELKDNGVGSERCYDRLTAAGVDLHAYNTVESAGDVIAVADALGYDQVNVFGSSYGSTLAFTVLRHYPERVRSLILEGVTPPEVDLMTSWASSLQRAWNHVVAACESKKACSAAYPNLDEMLPAVVKRLNADPLKLSVVHPVTGETVEATIDGEAVLSGLQSILYRYDQLPQIPLMVAALYTENEAVVAQLAQTALQSDVDTQSEGAFFAMRCSDDVLTTTQAASDAALAQVDPIYAEQFADTFGSWGETCARWGTALDPVENTPVVSDVPVLMLSGAFDPVTPPEWSDAAAANLTYGYSFTFPESTHGVLPDSCATGIARQFLTDPLVRPRADCIDGYAGIFFQTPPK